MANSTLANIKNKVRRLTRSLSPAQLTDSEITDYINTYIQYDLPETLRLFDLKSTFTFYTSPFIDTYATSTFVNNPMYDFKNKYISVNPPLYIAGFQSQFFQSREQFYGIYPIVNSIQNIGVTGDGSTLVYPGYVTTSQPGFYPNQTTQLITLLQNQVLFSSIDIYGNGLAMADSPILDIVTGTPTNFGLLYNALNTNETPYDPITNPNGIPTLSLAAPYKSQSNFPSTNFINYLTGEFNVTFPTAPEAGATINSQTVMNNPALPQSVLFFEDAFVVRPVPDQSYRIDIEVFYQPSALLLDTDVPVLNQWWQLIAFNAAKKILEDRMDYDSIALFLPSLREQERLVGRRTIKQNATQRVATIFSDQAGAGALNNSSWTGGSQF
jgi:hypothetical protein